MKDEAAIKPNSIFNNLASFERESQESADTISDEEKAIATLANTAGWRALKGFIQSVNGDLDNINATAIENGASFEELGRNVLVVNLTKGVIQRILDKVDDCKEASEKSDGTLIDETK